MFKEFPAQNHTLCLRIFLKKSDLLERHIPVRLTPRVPPPPPPGARSSSPKPPIMSEKGHTPYLGIGFHGQFQKTPPFPGFLGKSSLD